MRDKIRRVRQNKRLSLLLIMYAALLLAISVIACSFAVREREESLSSQIELVMAGIDREYRHMTEGFYQVYMPIFENQTVYGALSKYYDRSDLQMSPEDRRDLSSAIYQMMLRDDNVDWIALYAPERDKNYMMARHSGTLYELTDDFPHIEYLKARRSGMDVLGMTDIGSPVSVSKTFAICGGVPRTMNGGAVLVGYKTLPFEHITDGYHFLMESMQCYILAGGNAVYSYTGEYDAEKLWQPTKAVRGRVAAPDGSELYAVAQTCGASDTFLVCAVDYSEMRAYILYNAVQILMLVLLFAAISYAVMLRTTQRINREVSAVQDGLREIGANNLDYRITGKFTHSGMEEIAQSINETAFRLKENVNRAHYWQLRRKEAELSDLQSKFNPHFLYNTLEMLRSRCQQSGNAEIAELISNLAMIFRGLIGKTAFISMWEELSNTKRYLALFSARYEDRVDVRFNIDSSLLKYGVIRNLFQPLIENYFQYGLDTSHSDNYILFKGESLSDEYMRLSVEDNGSGMTEDAMRALNEKLHLPITDEKESYGLKNLHQRLTLFYGEGCGLQITPNGERGIRVEMTVKKLTCEEYEKSGREINAP